MTKWSHPQCETRILIKLLLSMTYIFIVFKMWVSPLLYDAIQLVIAGDDNVPTESSHDDIILRPDVSTSHEESENCY